MKTAQLLDARGQPVKKAELKAEISRATIGGVRSPISGYPADGLNPNRLASILREADAGDAIRYLELAETIEERDAHYLGVLGTRRRAVSQMPFTVEAGDDTPEAEGHAKMVRDWLMRDELTEEVFDILDTIGKGYSMSEIIWDTSEGQWMPLRLEYRDPRWFRFDRNDLKTPLMLTDTGQEVALPAFKFIFAQIKAKSGITLRSGLARVAAWGWMFKAYTQRDWAIFTQTYGQPLRLGKFGPSASEADKNTLFTAVSNIAGDCAAIIPESMQIEFIETSNVGASSDLYERRANWLDQQISKAVLGQTATTDAVTGGLGSGKEHREVQKSIQTADARALAAILNRDLIRPWMQLCFGPLKVYPRLKIEEPEKEDLVALSTAIGGLVDRGLEVDQGELRDKFGLSDPKPGAKLLRPSGGAGGGGAPVTGPQPPDREIKSNPGEFKRVEPLPDTETALNREGASTARKSAPSETDLPAARLADRLATEAAPAMGAMLAKIEAMLEAAGSLEEFREMVLTVYPDLDVTELAGVMAEAMMAGHAGGRATVLAESEPGDGE
jgi:phage gp29-like protein